MKKHPKPKVLFLCTGNACRSQMAEGWARYMHGKILEPYSAGIEPHGLDPRAVRVMAEAGVDISRQDSKPLDALKELEFDYVVTVCDSARECCPIFPGRAQVFHAGFDDPARPDEPVQNASEEWTLFRRVRDEIRDFVARLPALFNVRRTGSDP